MRQVCSRWPQLDIAHAGSFIAIAGAIPTVGKLAGRVCRQAYSWLWRFLLASVTLPAGDPLNRSVVKWMLANKPRHCRSFTGRTEISRSGMDRGAALKKTQHPVQYCPHWQTRCFFFEGRLFIVTKASDAFSTSPSDPAYDGFGGEDLTIGCLGWSAEPAKRLIAACREYAERQTQFYVIIYSRDRYGLSWKPKSRTPLRHLDTVHFDRHVKKELLADIRNYLDPATQKRYQSRSMPYRRGYLFYGPPGTGKSSLSIAVAGEFGLDMYEVKVPSVSSDADLESMFSELPPRCIVLLEDVDAAWTNRASPGQGGRDSDSVASCTLSGILNVLDGVGSQEGRIVIMTTNRPDQLDSALIRPGRVDMRVFLGNISPESARDMFVRMFSAEVGCAIQFDEVELHAMASQFASFIPDKTFTPSLLQGFFQLHLDNPRDAVDSIGPWVEREITRASTQVSG